MTEMLVWSVNMAVDEPTYRDLLSSAISRLSSGPLHCARIAHAD